MLLQIALFGGTWVKTMKGGREGGRDRLRREGRKTGSKHAVQDMQERSEEGIEGSGKGERVGNGGERLKVSLIQVSRECFVKKTMKGGRNGFTMGDGEPKVWREVLRNAYVQEYGFVRLRWGV